MIIPNIVTCGGTFDYAFDGVPIIQGDLSNLRLLPNMEILHLGVKKKLISW